jgi:hypothetical protein
MKKNTKLFFTIEGLEWDKLLKMHKIVAKAPTKEICDLFGEEFDETKKDKRVAKDDVLIKKYEFFLHNLIKRQISSDNGIAYLNSKVLEKVFGKDYLLIKRTLHSCGITHSTGYFDTGTTSYGYYLSYDYQNRIKTERKPIFYPSQNMVEKLNEELKKNKKKVSKSAQENLTDDFYDSYVNSLNKLKLVYSKQAQKFIDVHFSQNNNSKHYYEYILEEYNNSKFFIKVPNLKDNRIYHILTSTPRNLKYFLNIKYTIDIHNSHPLLFSKFLMDKYNIHVSYRTLIISSLLENNPYINVYNVRKKLYNILKQNNIDYKEILDIPLDVLKYLYLVCSGKFWNVVIPTLEEKTTNTYNIIRQDVKVIMFAQVFYGKSLTSRGKKYAKSFKQQFPNVYSVVLSFKRGLAKEKRTVLTHKLMALESQLFRETMKRLFEKGYKVISIHDAIVVLNVDENENLTPEMVKDVLCEVYSEVGLVPDCSVDFYGEKEMQKFMEKEKFLREKGDEYLAELRQLAEDDEDIKVLVEDYDNGRSEIILTPDGKDVMLHLKDVKTIMYK